MKNHKTATLFNGTKVKEGDIVSFITSDGIECKDQIRRRPNGSLYFWNITKRIKEDYSAKKEN